VQHVRIALQRIHEFAIDAGNSVQEIKRRVIC
jgi:hypothetical protein